MTMLLNTINIHPFVLFLKLCHPPDFKIIFLRGISVYVIVSEIPFSREVISDSSIPQLFCQILT